jgi:hypothetical protein
VKKVKEIFEELYLCFKHVQHKSKDFDLIHKKIRFCFVRVPLTKDQQIIEPDWEIYLRNTARLISEQQTPQR